MNTEKIESTFLEIAKRAVDPTISAFVVELAQLFTEQFNQATAERQEIELAIKATDESFKELSTLVLGRLQNNESDQAEKIAILLDRVHGLANRFMAVEDKANQSMEYFEMRFDELVKLLKEDRAKQRHGTTQAKSN